MKAFRYILAIILATIPALLPATSPNEILGKLNKALFLKEWNRATECFRLLTDTSTGEAETYFWDKVGTDCPCRAGMARILGDFHKRKNDYSKAFVFYNELLKDTDNSLEALQVCAEMKIKSGKTEEALPFYEQMLLLDSTNLAANIFVGNYYYFFAEKECMQMKKEYSKLQTPTKMDYAKYRERLNSLVTQEYAKAKGYLQRVQAQFPSREIKKALQQIKTLETENAQ